MRTIPYKKCAKHVILMGEAVTCPSPCVCTEDSHQLRRGVVVLITLQEFWSSWYVFVPLKCVLIAVRVIGKQTNPLRHYITPEISLLHHTILSLYYSVHIMKLIDTQIIYSSLYSRRNFLIINFIVVCCTNKLSHSKLSRYNFLIT